MHNKEQTPQKAKNFKEAITRLFKELKGFSVIITIALVLAALGSILSIIAPDKLADITDQISDGLVVNKENLETVSKKTTASLDEKTLEKKMPEILSLNISEEANFNIAASSSITPEEKQKYMEIMKEISASQDKTKALEKLLELPNSILKIILPETTYENIKVTTQDKIELLKLTKEDAENKKDIKFPESIQNILFKEFKIDGTKITPKDQAKFIEIMSTLDKDAKVNELYSKIDEMPKNIQKVVEPFMNMDKIKALALFLVIIYLLSALFTYIETIIMATVSNKFAKRLREDISEKINILPLKYFDKHKAGDTLSRVTNDVDTIAQSMNQSLSTLVGALTLFIGTIIMMFVTNWIMALTAIISSMLGFSLMFLILGKSQKYFVARQVELGNLNGHIEEVYSGLNVIKAYNGGAEANKKFDEYNHKVYNANQKSQFLSGLMMPLMTFVGNFGYVAVCIVGALLTVNNVISFGVIVAFIAYVRLFTSPLSQIAQSFTLLQSTAAASERVFEFLDEKELTKEENTKKHLDKDKVKGEIEFENVTFTYDGNEKPTINNFSAKALPGQKIAIVGPTGAGKTTMVNLLMKFYDINSGDIKIDGISTKDLTRENVHELFTMVLQDTWLFNGTVKENIVYNRENISNEKIKEVCDTVGISHFIKTLPQGYDSKIDDNDSVSAGQRQLLTIARGMIEDTPFLILDEATSNVDTRTEELVQNAMDKLTKGKTSFIIAHRLSTIKNADLILVMKDGNIIEQGNHEELMKQKGFYADLYNSQFEL